MARSRFRIKGRFFALIFGFLGVIALVVVILQLTKKTGEIQFGTLGATLEVNAAIIREENVVKSEQYEKVTFNVTEGELVSPNQVIAQLYKRGYQDETMISLLNLQKGVYHYQMQLLGGQDASPELTELNDTFASVEMNIRAVSRDESELDMLALEQTLKDLETQRAALLQGLVTPDANLTQQYQQVEAQQQVLSSWRRDVLNNAGTGIVSFYFDGYEQALNANKLSTLNSALVKSVVQGGNTAKNADSTSETPLYRVINNTHWYVAFVTDATDPMRLAEGEEYSVVFTDYSEQAYTAIARATTVSEKSVVNLLEFNTDIGKLIGVRTVKASISKSAQGLVVPLKAIVVENGIPGVNISYGDTAVRVEVDILAQDEKKAIIRARGGADTLVAGQKYIKP